MLIDTHCHLDFVWRQLETQIVKLQDLPEIKIVIDRAILSGIEKFINVGCDVPSSRNSLFLSENFANVFATIGVHPTDCNSDWKDSVRQLKNIITNYPRAKLVAVGETGIDYYHQPFNRQNQQDAFRAQIELALELGLPVSVHTRGDGAGDDVLKILEPYIANNLTGVIHCFQQSLDFAKVTTNWGFLLGIDGPIDYPKNTLMRQIVKEIGLDKLVLETDTPFLPPQIYRGKKNEPAYLKHVAIALADLFGIDVQVVSDVTSSNACRLFKI